MDDGNGNTDEGLIRACPKEEDMVDKERLAAAFPRIGGIKGKGDKSLLRKEVGIETGRLFLHASRRMNAQDGRIASGDLKVLRKKKH